MEDKLENKVASIIVIEKVEENKDKKKTRVFFAAMDGIHLIEIPARKEETGFAVGQRYIGLFEPYDSFDLFITPKGVSRETIATSSYELKRIEDLHGNVVYERKEIKKKNNKK